MAAKKTGKRLRLGRGRNTIAVGQIRKHLLTVQACRGCGATMTDEMIQMWYETWNNEIHPFTVVCPECDQRNRVHPSVGISFYVGKPAPLEKE